MRKLTYYEKSIIEATGCKESEVAAVEDTMRHVIFHSTLDWLSAKAFNKGAKEAYEVVKVTAYMEKHGCSFDEAYDAVTPKVVVVTPAVVTI